MNEKLKEALATLKELGFEPVKDAINHRVKSPFFGGFVISWLFLNWDKVLIICFSSTPIKERITSIKSIPSNSIIWDYNVAHTHTFWFPLLASVLITILSPFISFLIELIHKWVIAETEGNRFSRQAAILSKKSNLITVEVRNESQRDTELLKVKAIQAATQAEIAASNASIESLESQSKTLSEQIDAKTETHGTLSNNIYSLQEKLDNLTPVVSELERKYEALSEFENQIKNKDDIIKNLRIELDLLKYEDNKERRKLQFPSPLKLTPETITTSNEITGANFIRVPKNSVTTKE
ncbi:FtsZ-binding cell division protein ZapB [Ewingella americana]